MDAGWYLDGAGKTGTLNCLLERRERFQATVRMRDKNVHSIFKRGLQVSS